MNTLLAIPFEVRLSALFVIGSIVAGQLNRAVYGWALDPSPISPWSAAPRGLPARRWSECVPIFGWLIARDRAHKFGRGFWIRPLLVELLTGLSLAALYAWEVDVGGLIPLPLPANISHHDVAIQSLLHSEYLAHAVLLCLMIVASLIDIDGKIIPDEITLPGTLLGMILMVCLPHALLPVPDLVAWARLNFGFWPLVEPVIPLYANYPKPRQPLEFTQTVASLWVGLAVVVGWCLALLPRHWRTRHGLRRARQILLARIAKEPISKLIAVVGVLACVGVTLTYWHNGPRWTSLYSALIGLAASGGMIWAVRLIAGFVLGREAMGFGDVTLMAMIGTFLGWQACLAVFFIAPFAGLFVGGAQWLLRRDNEIPYGPYLCLGAAVVIVFWNSLWDHMEPMFAAGWLVPIAVVICMGGLGVLLGLLQIVKRMIGIS